MRTIPVKTTYLSMSAPPTGKARPAPREDLLLLQAWQPTAAFYRFLYGEVGRDLHWVDRHQLDDASLLQALHDPAVTLVVLYVAGVPAGYFELCAEADASIRLAYFGLMPPFRGLGLGSWLLEQAIRTAWACQPQRLWLHTCELDAPAALPTYLKAGFAISHTEIVQQALPDDTSSD
ncbi:MAG: GNAT family N-acetyltransferase [Candidatus Melainabacteria bacterium HGW-Melainabacteria-1]|nr:MAG: GNAT family N-acetyltransferase [Candidatus Melainabacteria bacterium HGW-Melainabacteria-1]